MLSGTFWTLGHVTGIILILSNVISGVGLSFYAFVKDKGGPFIFGQPPHEWLRLIAAHARAWRWGTMIFIAGVLMTVLGLALLAGLLRSTGDLVFAQLGLLAFTFGAVLWIINLTSRCTLEIWVARETARTHAIPDFYPALAAWNSGLFVIYTVLAFMALAAFGAAITGSSLLPQWVGWAAILYGLIGLIVLGVTRDALPLFHHVMPLVIGILLLLG